MSSKTTEELIKILENKDSYVDEAINAAHYELDQRGVDVDSISDLKKLLVNQRKLGLQVNQDASVFNSKSAVFFISLLTAPLIGSLYLGGYLMNLRKKLPAIIVLIFGVSYTTLSIILVYYTPFPFATMSVSNLFGAAVLSELFWGVYGLNKKVD